MASSLRTGDHLTPLQGKSVKGMVGSEDDRLDNGASLTSVAPDLDAAEGNHIRMLEEVDRFHEHPPTSTERESKKVDSSSSADANKSTSVAIGNALQLPDRPIPIEHVLANDYDFPEQLESLSIEEKEILEAGSGEGLWRIFRYEYPSC